MKYSALSILLVCSGLALQAQNNYPEPEFSNEVYFLKKDSVNTAIRLEKESSKMDTKAKMGGMGGAESGYNIEGEKSSVRLHSGNKLSFVFSTGASAGSSSSTAQRDSIMRANGMDPSTMQGGMGSMNDPANTITLYKAESSKGKRKIHLMKSGGAFSMGKNKSSDKYTFSIKKIREGYWELIIDKSLSKGEYAFVTMGGYSGGGGMDAVLFAFGIE